MKIKKKFVIAVLTEQGGLDICFIDTDKEPDCEAIEAYLSGLYDLSKIQWQLINRVSFNNYNVMWRHVK